MRITFPISILADRLSGIRAKPLSYWLRFPWLFLLIVQVSCIAYFIDDTSAFGIYNFDSFSYHIQWSKISETLNPFHESVLHDPGHDLKRIPFSFPHFVMGFTLQFFTPLQSYLIWCCIGVLATYASTYWFARSLNFSKNAAHVAVLIHYTFFHVLSQLPPLSGNQLNYLVDAVGFKPEYLMHFGPRQYPHDIFFYPLLYTLMALTLFGIKKIRNSEHIQLLYAVAWALLASLLPFNYFYHWLEYGCMLATLVMAGFLLKWWKFPDLLMRHKSIGMLIGVTVVIWLAVFIFQNGQLSDTEGYRFALMGGLTEARFILLPSGLLIRVLAWTALLLLVMKLKPQAIMLVGFLIICLLLMNMQLVAGKNIQPGHWSFGVERIFTWILIGLVYWKIWPRISGKRIAGILKPAMIAGCLIFFTVQSYISWKSFASLSRWPKDRIALIDFLKQVPASVVLVPEIWLETDILVHTPHRSFLPRGAQSAIDEKEHLERITHASLLLGYSKDGLSKWLHTRPVRFFGMLYGIEKEFSSSLYFDPDKKSEVLKFHKGTLPSWDEKIISSYLADRSNLEKKLDLIVLHKCETVPASVKKILFENGSYIVASLEPLQAKEWGLNEPIGEQKYPLTKHTCLKK